MTANQNGKNGRGYSDSSSPVLSFGQPATPSLHASSRPIVRKISRGHSISLLAMLGCLWGVVEIQFGTLMQILGVPFHGVVLAGFAVVILSFGRLFIGVRGSALAVGICAAFLKTLFVGSLAFYPVIGILIESAIVEVTLWTRSPKQRHFLLAGALTVGTMLFFPFLSHGVLGGWKIVDVYYNILQKASSIIGIGEENAIVIVAVLFIAHAGVGLLSGIVARLGINLMQRRLSYSIPAATNKLTSQDTALKITATGQK